MSMLNWQGWAANWAGWGSEGVEAPVVARGLQPAGSPRREPRRKKLWIEPEDNGPIIEVETAAEVPKAVKAIKRQAKAIAEKAVRKREPLPELPKWVVHGDAPFADELKRKLAEIEANYAYVYQRMLMDEDDDEVIALIL